MSGQIGQNGQNGQSNWSAGSIDPRLLDPSGVANSSKVSFPGFDNIPFRGPVPTLKENDPDHLKPQVACKVHVQQFDMSNKEHMEEYSKMAQLVGNGFAQISFEERVYDAELKSWRILIRWFEVYTFDPQQGEPRGRIR